MIHILDGQNDLILDVITLDKLIDDSHHKSLVDFIETYEFTALIDDSYSDYLTDRNRLIIPDDNGDLREFVIVKAEKIRDRGGLIVNVFAQATYLDLSKLNVVRPYSFKGTPSQHIGRALNDTGWQAGVIEVGGNITISEENFTSPYAYLRRIAKEFGGELNYRITHDGNKITGRYVDLLERIGQWRGKEVSLGKDIESIRRVEEQDVVTALLGLGPVREDGSRIEVLVEDEDALQRWGRIDENGNLHHLIEAYEIESERDDMSEAEARQYTRTALDKRISLMVTYETTIVDLADVAGLEHEEMFFGDTIRIKDEGFSPPLYLEARIFEMDRSLKQKAKKDIKLGDYIEYTEEEVNTLWAQLQAEIQRRIEKIVLVNIESSGGIVFKESEGTTELTAKTFVGGAEYDEDGTVYNYLWSIYDKDGNFLTAENGKSYSLEINAIELHETLTVRIYVGKGAEVYAQTEITLTFVKDGEKGDKGDDGGDGPPGPPGDKGEDGDPGRSVVEVSEQYYMSTSNLSPTGGAWLDDKPPHTADKFLWMRTKVTYDKAPLIEYTSPILDDGWIALSTADGNNTIIFDDVAPPIEGRKPGDIWYDTANDNRMSKFDGNQWTVAPLGERAIAAESITALHIKSLFGLNVNDQFIVDSQGNVEFGGHLQGASGTFGEVTAEDDNFYLEDPETGTKSYAIFKNNLFKDHSFENVGIGNILDTNRQIYLAVNRSPNEVSGWTFVGKPRVMNRYEEPYGTSQVMFGYQSLIVSSSHQAYQVVKLAPGTTVTVSLHAKQVQGWNAGIPRVRIENVSESNTVLSSHVEDFDAVTLDTKRYSFTYTVPNNSTIFFTRIYFLSANTSWLILDGVQCVESPYPSQYAPEESIADLINGNIRAHILHSSKFEAETIRFRHYSAIDFDQYGNISAPITATPGAYWNIKDYQGTVIFRVYLGSDRKNSDNGVQVNAGMVFNVTSGRIRNQSTYDTTTGAAANMYVATNGFYARSTSARKYKMLEEPITVDPYKLLELQPKTWFDKPQVEKFAEELTKEYQGKDTDFESLMTTRIKRIPGLVAEDVEEVGLEQFVTYDEEGNIEGLQYDRLWTLLIPIVRDLKEENERLKDDIKDLLKRVEKLENAE